MILALDLGGTKLAISLVDGDEVGHVEKRASDFSSWQACLNWIECYLTDHSHPELQGIALACAGRVVGGRVNRLNRSVLSFLEGVDLQAELEDRFGLPVLLVNDASAAAWAEYIELTKAGQIALDEPFAYLTVSTGVGVGLISGGRILASPDGMASHAGHIKGPIEDGFPAADCTCGLTGCIESYASGAALGRLASNHLGHPQTAIDVFSSRDDIPYYQTLIQMSARQIAFLVDTMAMTLGIRHFVLGGGVGQRLDYQQAVKAWLVERPGLPESKIYPACLDSLCGLVGVARLFEQRTCNQ